MPNIFILSTVLFIGGLVALQGPINSRLAQYVNHPLQAALISLITGTISLVIIHLGLNVSLPSLRQLAETPVYLWTGGIIGAAFLCSAIILIPRIGSLPFLAGLIFGQLLMAVVIDHFGILGVPVAKFSWMKAAGIGLLVMGFLLIRK